MQVIVSLIFLSLLLWSQTINEQIHALEKATPQERVELMNSIKKQLVSMNAQKRMETIEALRAKIENTEEEPKNELNHRDEERIEEHDEEESHSETLNIHHDMQEELVHHREVASRHNELHQHEYQHGHRVNEDQRISSECMGNREGAR